MQGILNRSHRENNRFDTDRKIPIPCILLMKDKGAGESVSRAHYDPMAAMMASFQTKKKESTTHLFGDLDVGNNVLMGLQATQAAPCDHSVVARKLSLG